MEYNTIINKEVLTTYLKEHGGRIALLDLIIGLLQTIRAQLDQKSEIFELQDYKRVDRSDAHVRQAIERLREEHLLSQKVNWLGVLKVLLWTRVLVDDYGCYAKTETYLKRLFPNDPQLNGLANSLNKKCRRDSFLEENLECWMKDKRQNRYGVHLTIAQRFLTWLQEG